MSYALTEIFHSLQGEGFHAGRSTVFIRFAGCNLSCKADTAGFDCDTDFHMRFRADAGTIAERARALAPRCDWVVLTGGEPTLQVDRELVDALRARGFGVAMETNGTRVVAPGLVDWITMAPKLPTLAIQEANEVKWVLRRGSTPADIAARVGGWPKSEHTYLSPAFLGTQPDPDAIAWCAELVKENPSWRLTSQFHKFWQIP